ncbi:FUSC family protein [Phycicoccus sonneratiae]|uniref:FUSC family protein n=1 Tax=Phycicoccus sonneratiae TaxID=2807628 RepID=A0ABS2CL55_9MICO|nr:FUSC family protein [Phycicoccus sonneraticus]MBM6400530.1 FUSC family protein [Phycicoccus sonneraticus]
MNVPWPPPRVLALAAGLVLVVGALAGAVGGLAGRAAALGILLGALGALTAAVTGLPLVSRLSVAALATAAFALGQLGAGRPVVAGAVVALASLAPAPLTVRAARVGTFLPVLAALGSGLPLGGAAPTVAAWVGVGALAVVALGVVLPVSVPAEPVPRDEAWRHAAATALVAGAGTVVTTALHLGHGYWLVVAVALVLAVSRDQTGTQAAQRVVGTVVGVLAGVVAVAFLPTAVSLVLAGALSVLGLAWTVVRETRFVAATSSAAVVLVGSGGLVGAGAGLAAERLLLTVAGAVCAAGAVAVLHRQEVSP